MLHYGVNHRQYEYSSIDAEPQLDHYYHQVMLLSGILQLDSENWHDESTTF